ncbi:DUF502 domain-containing protein [Cerasicoccus arenae]|uniref:DUF502 domain-containing protein n=1 Tax=Cerasicoccus arenae TaxID=424488 RepID=A0A8J3DEB4_9BACT|nr:DUF502 domain-containing protein [Cerasicoccus arenae]MBK1858501.1 DUF502 domain-containing protein [Cerasicoccus arenae]GHC10240.1 hypothetical protein GCM10007047_29450 [Cerasicoccus arenae]
MLRQLRNGFFAGLIIAAPLGVTIFVVNFMLSRIGEPISNAIFQFIDEAIRNQWFIQLLLSIASIFIVVLVITLLGFLSRYFIGRIFINLSERIINAVPFINAVYKTVKQIVDTFSKQQKAVFQKVVLTEYPRKGVYVLGFLTSDAKGEVQNKTGAEVVNVFVPTTPNPTSGFLLMVPRDEVIIMEMTIADGMKLIVSGGAVTPPFREGTDELTVETASGNI